MTWIVITYPLNNSLDMAEDLLRLSKNFSNQTDGSHFYFYAEFSQYIHYAVLVPVIIIFIHALAIIAMYPGSNKNMKTGQISSAIKNLLKQIRGCIAGIFIGISVTVAFLERIYFSITGIYSFSPRISYSSKMIIAHIAISALLFIVSIFSKNLLNFRIYIIQSEFPTKMDLTDREQLRGELFQRSKALA